MVNQRPRLWNKDKSTDWITNRGWAGQSSISATLFVLVLDSEWDRTLTDNRPAWNGPRGISFRNSVAEGSIIVTDIRYRAASARETKTNVGLRLIRGWLNLPRGWKPLQWNHLKIAGLSRRFTGFYWVSFRETSRINRRKEWVTFSIDILRVGGLWSHVDQLFG